MKLLRLFLLLILFPLYQCHIPRAIIWAKPDFKDSKKLPAFKIKKSEVPFLFKIADDKNKKGFKEKIDALNYTDSFLEKSGTLALIVIKNDTIFYEKYFNGLTPHQKVPIFSSAKSLTSALAGIAIHEGFINGIESQILDYIPELDNEIFKDVRIENLLNMNSGIGINMKGDLNLNRGPARYYYATDFRKRLFSDDLFYRKNNPGEKFEYKDLNAQLLGIVIERAPNKPLSEYFQEKIWRKIGTEHNASWAIADKELEMTKAYCCFNSTALDLARFGRLFLKKGKWKGEQIIPKDWVRNSLETMVASPYWHYSYMWWHTIAYDEVTNDNKIIKEENKPARYYKQYPREDAMTNGKLGQYIYLYPNEDVIIIRLGKKNGKIKYSKKFKQSINWGNVMFKMANVF